jgi:dienelactone hydrolase
MSHRTKLILVTVTLLLSTQLVASPPRQGAGISRISFAPYGPEYRIASYSLVLRDNKRDKDLPINVVYPYNFPTQKTSLPTIVFSHGAGGSGNMYQPLAQFWATQGYIVILPTHSDSIVLKRKSEDDTNVNERRRMQSRRLYRRGLENGSLVAGAIDFSDWANRPRDISYIIDSLDEIEKQTPLNNQAIDRDRIGVGGHSYGAFTSQLINGTDPLGPADFTDPRATCALLISPQGTGGLFTKDAWDNFQGPALTITGDNDEGREGQPATWRREPYDHSPPNTHTLLWINDAYHNFGGISGQVLPLPDQGPENPTHVQLVQNATLAFWNHHLKDQSHDIAQFADTLEQRLDSDEVIIEHN